MVRLLAATLIQHSLPGYRIANRITLSCFLDGAPPVVAILGMWFIAFLICATFIDLDHMIIQDRFSIGGMV